MALLFMNVLGALAVAFAVTCSLQGCGGEKPKCDPKAIKEPVEKYSKTLESCMAEAVKKTTDEQKEAKAKCCEDKLFDTVKTTYDKQITACSDDQKKDITPAYVEAVEKKAKKCPKPTSAATALASITDAADVLPAKTMPF